MNIVLLKGLIIAGGAAGIGVPGIYYGYPYISSLINPETKKDTPKPAEEPVQTKSDHAEGGEVGKEKASKDTQISLPVAGEGGSNSSSNQQSKSPKDTTSNAEDGESSGQKTGTSNPGGTGTHNEQEGNSNVQ